MEVIVKNTYEEISALAAQMIAELVRKKPTCVLGLATGNSPWEYIRSSFACTVRMGSTSQR